MRSCLVKMFDLLVGKVCAIIGGKVCVSLVGKVCLISWLVKYVRSIGW